MIRLRLLRSEDLLNFGPIDLTIADLAQFSKSLGAAIA